MEIHLQSGNVDHRGVRVADSVGRVAAIVILYHPKTGVLERLLKSVDGQVSSIFLIDNTPEGIPSYPYEHCDWKSTVGYWSMGENKGIAAAQNFGIERALKSGIRTCSSWIRTAACLVTSSPRCSRPKFGSPIEKSGSPL